MLNRALHLSAIASNLIFFLFVLYILKTSGGPIGHGGIEYKDFISIILTALAALLAILAIFIGALAIWGYTTIKQAAIDAAIPAAEAKADESAKVIAATVAQAIAETVAARTAEQIVARYVPATDSNAMTAALSERGTDERSAPPPDDASRSLEREYPDQSASGRGEDSARTRSADLSPQRFVAGRSGHDNQRSSKPISIWFRDPRKRP